MIFSFKLQDDFKNKQQMSAQLGQPMQCWNWSSISERSPRSIFNNTWEVKNFFSISSWISRLNDRNSYLVSKPEINQGKNVYVLQYVQHRLNMGKIMKTGYLQNAPQTHLSKAERSEYIADRLGPWTTFLDCLSQGSSQSNTFHNRLAKPACRN